VRSVARSWRPLAASTKRSFATRIMNSTGGFALLVMSCGSTPRLRSSTDRGVHFAHSPHSSGSSAVGNGECSWSTRDRCVFVSSQRHRCSSASSPLWRWQLSVHRWRSWFPVCICLRSSAQRCGVVDPRNVEWRWPSSRCTSRGARGSCSDADACCVAQSRVVSVVPPPRIWSRYFSSTGAGSPSSSTRP